MFATKGLVQCAGGLVISAMMPEIIDLADGSPVSVTLRSVLELDADERRRVVVCQKVEKRAGDKFGVSSAQVEWYDGMCCCLFNLDDDSEALNRILASRPEPERVRVRKWLDVFRKAEIGYALAGEADPVD